MKYEIRLEDLLPTEREIWFEGWHKIHLPESDTILRGIVHDQVALHGTLTKIRDLNIPVQLVKRIE